MFLKELGKPDALTDQQNDDVKRITKWSSNQKSDAQWPNRNMDLTGNPKWVFKNPDVLEDQFIDAEVVSFHETFTLKPKKLASACSYCDTLTTAKGICKYCMIGKLQ